MLTKSAAALAIGSLAFAPSTTTTVEGFANSAGALTQQRHGSGKSRRNRQSSPGVPPSSSCPSHRNPSPPGSFSSWDPSRQTPSTTTMALSAGARRPAEQEPTSQSVSSHSSHLDDYRYVAPIKGGVRDYLEAMDQSLSGELVTVVTYMPWCRSCHHLRHHLRMIAQAYAIAESGAMFFEIDLNKNPEVHKMLDIHAAPTILLYSGGQLVDEFTCAGSSGPKVMLRHIEAQIGEVPDLRHADMSDPYPESPTPGTTSEYIPARKNDA